MTDFSIPAANPARHFAESFATHKSFEDLRTPLRVRPGIQLARSPADHLGPGIAQKFQKRLVAVLNHAVAQARDADAHRTQVQDGLQAQLAFEQAMIMAFTRRNSVHGKPTAFRLLSEQVLTSLSGM